MQEQATGPRVFISYSHKDASVLDRLKVHLRPYEWSGAVDVWDDQRLTPGQQWLNEIRSAIAAADVAVLLVSPDFLASRFIKDNELPPLLDGKRVLWVLISHCAYDKTPIGDYQCTHDPAKPLKKLSVVDRDKVLAHLCRMIAGHVPPVTGVAPSETDAARVAIQGLELISIPAGRFRMGDDLHWEETGAYRIGKYPVTVAQYRRFCEETGREMPPPPDWGWVDNHPMVHVTWFDARDFCAWAGGRLPTEAEWEKAARWDEEKKHSREWPWGDEWKPGLCANSVPPDDMTSTAPVGSFPSGVSPYGCHDMAGNVWEWCHDRLDAAGEPIPESEVDDKKTSVSYRALRGGSWFCDFPGIFRAAFRDGFDPDHWYYYFGFRIALPGDVR